MCLMTQLVIERLSLSQLFRARDALKILEDLDIGEANKDVYKSINESIIKKVLEKEKEELDELIIQRAKRME